MTLRVTIKLATKNQSTNTRVCPLKPFHLNTCTYESSRSACSATVSHGQFLQPTSSPLGPLFGSTTTSMYIALPPPLNISGPKIRSVRWWLRTNFAVLCVAMIVGSHLLVVFDAAVVASLRGWH
ncbi:hypothetical protein B0H66DRAFT_597060 [Apodospora peruviana]|uniref:Uncharacterized protein n=1 Tax=Apodospora peruviana TaxID=516989 RepID=A0AAE0MF71_9PEZI|nr:hypothetical protein B0H66DRAFT_597060 [Apodospora peruviana]